MPVIQLHNFSKKIKWGLEQLPHWIDIQSIFQALHQKKRLCWISGGAVRDLILERRPSDIDLTTDALEEEILELFPEAILVGREFGVYKIPRHGKVYDLTVFREEGEYIDGRRPTTIQRSNPEKDAQRRDFTVNALFWDLDQQVLVDCVGGVADLEKRYIRCVGQPLVRFQEDYLRVLRMVRLAYQLDFKIDPESYRAGLSQAQALTQISGERILGELLKMTEAESRWNLYQDELFQNIMKSNGFVFKDFETKSLRVKIELPVLFEILYLLDFNLYELDLIQKRLKISNEQKQFLIRACEIQNLILQKTAMEEFCLLLDRSQDYQKIMEYFSELELMDKNLEKQIRETYAKHKAPLITAQDVIDKVPAQQISKVLKLVRLSQFSGQISDRNAAFDYIAKIN